jgi:hypothetical protein
MAMMVPPSPLRSEKRQPPLSSVFFPPNLSVIQLSFDDHRDDTVGLIREGTPFTDAALRWQASGGWDQKVNGDVYKALLLVNDIRRAVLLTADDLDMARMEGAYRAYYDALTASAAAAGTTDAPVRLCTYSWGGHRVADVDFERCMVLYNIGMVALRQASYTSASYLQDATHPMSKDEATSMHMHLCRAAGAFDRMAQLFPQCGHWGTDSSPVARCIPRRDAAVAWSRLAMALAQTCIYSRAVSASNLAIHAAWVRLAQNMKVRWNEVPAPSGGDTGVVDPLYVRAMQGLCSAIVKYHWGMHHAQAKDTPSNHGIAVKCYSCALKCVARSLAPFRDAAAFAAAIGGGGSGGGGAAGDVSLSEWFSNRLGALLPNRNDADRMRIEEFVYEHGTLLRAMHEWCALLETTLSAARKDNAEIYHDPIPSHFRDLAQPSLQQTNTSAVTWWPEPRAWVEQAPAPDDRTAQAYVALGAQLKAMPMSATCDRPADAHYALACEVLLKRLTGATVLLSRARRRPDERQAPPPLPYFTTDGGPESRAPLLSAREARAIDIATAYVDDLCAMLRALLGTGVHNARLLARITASVEDAERFAQNVNKRLGS